MTTTSIKETIEVIETAAADYFSNEIVEIYFEKFTNTKLEKAFPQVSFYYADAGTTTTLNTNVVSLQFEFLDVISGRKDKDDRRKEVVSDMFDLASRFVTHLRQNENLLIDPNVPMTPFDNRYKDGLGGVEFTLNVTMIKPCVS